MGRRRVDVAAADPPGGCLLGGHSAHNAHLGNGIWTSKAKEVPALLWGLEGIHCWIPMATWAQGPPHTDQSEWVEPRDVVIILE